MLKQWTLAAGATAMLSLMLPGTALAAGESSTLAPEVGARAAILVNARNGAILYEKNAFRQMDPASLTKMMTALLVIEHGHLNQVATIIQDLKQKGYQLVTMKKLLTYGTPNYRG